MTKKLGCWVCGKECNRECGGCSRHCDKHTSLSMLMVDHRELGEITYP